VIREEPKKKEPDINAFVFVQEEPKPINMDEVQAAVGYPTVARDADIEGVVVVRVLVDEYGNYRKHRIIKTAHPVLSEAVESKIKMLRFTPAIQGGKPIAFWVNVPFRFTLVK
jgi:protein TonB